MKIKTPHLIAATLFCALHSAMPQAADVQPPNANNNVYFGDVHVHTSWSFDGFTNGSKTTPMDAYAWAQGKLITGSGGFARTWPRRPSMLSSKEVSSPQI